MSMQEQQPTAEQIRSARRQGFGDSIGYMPAERQEAIAKSYVAQDSRREKNVSEFTAKVTGR